MKLTATEQREIEEVLSANGLKPVEQRVYLGLLQSGQSTLTPLARTLRMPPTTVESVLDRLVTHGLIGVTLAKSRRAYEAYEPVALRRRAEKNLKEIIETIPLFEKIQKNIPSTSRARVYYRERMNDIFERALAAKSKLVEEIVAGEPIQEILGQKYHFTKRRIEGGVRLRSLRVESREIKKYNRAIDSRELRESKFLPRELTFASSVIFWDSSVAFFTTKNEGLAILVDSPALATMMRQLFSLLWSISRPMVTA